MQVTIDIPPGNATEYMTCFLARHPKPADFVGTNVQWYKEWVLRQTKDAINAGKRILAAQAVVPVGDDIS